MPGHKREFARRGDRIEELVRRLESTGDPATRAVAQELVQAVIELHGAALERLLESVAEVDGGQQVLARVASDDLVSGVLSLHGIHPVDIRSRVLAAIEKAQPYLRSHHGDVELRSIEDGVVHVQLRGACGSCSSSSDTLKGAVESAIFDAAPEVVAVVADTEPPPHSDFVILQTT